MQGKAFPKLAAAILAALVLSACGSSSTSATSGNARALLRQTFSSAHKIRSGVLRFALVVQPTGSSTIQGPISLVLSGPFQSRGSGQVPESNLTISFTGLGHHGQLGVVSTVTGAYAILQGTAYQLPPAEFQRLQSGLSGATPGSGGLASLGINPLRWLSDPQIVGHDTIAGVPTTHLRARVDVNTMLADLNSFLQKRGAAATGGAGGIPTSIPPALESRIAAEVRNPRLDVWTGTADKTMRKLVVSLTLPVGGQGAVALGGMSSAGVSLTIQYSQLNRPQTITAPTNLRPFSEFAARVRAIAQRAAGSLGLPLPGAGAAAGGAANVGKYSQCIQRAAGDVTKMQKCAALLGGG